MIWPIDDDTTEPDPPLTCPGCHAIGDAPCAIGCRYNEGLDPFATLADRAYDEDANSDADPPDPWDGIF